MDDIIILGNGEFKLSPKRTITEISVEELVCAGVQRDKVRCHLSCLQANYYSHELSFFNPLYYELNIFIFNKHQQCTLLWSASSIIPHSEALHDTVIQCFWSGRRL